jgi:2'-5' RNA ligase
MRLFVALELPASHRASLVEVCERGRRGGVRWVPAENVHLTLKFLGEVDEARIPKIKDALASVAAAARPFALSLAGGGCFPNPRAPRVVWLGLDEGAGEAGALAATVEDALRPVGFAPEKRPFKPHLTIGRVKEPRAGAAAASGKVDALADYAAAPAPAEAVVLVKSTLTAEGSIYEEVARWRLGGD